MQIGSKPSKRILKRFLGLQQQKVQVNSFAQSNFNYCTLKWMSANCKFLTKIKKNIKERSDSCLTIIPVPTKGFWEKSGKYSMDVKRKHKLCIDMYIERYLNNLNPSFMK